MTRPGPPDSPHIRQAIDRWRRGEDPEGSFRVLANAYYPRLHGFFVARGLERESAHDLTQETFVRVYTGLDAFRAEASFDTWLFTVAGNVLRQAHRQRTTQKRGAGRMISSLEERTREPVVADAGPLDRAIDRQRTRALRRAVEDLPPRMRAVLKLHLYQGHSRRQIATALGVSEETVKAQLQQARRRLAEALTTGEEERP